MGLCGLRADWLKTSLWRKEFVFRRQSGAATCDGAGCQAIREFQVPESTPRVVGDRFTCFPQQEVKRVALPTVRVCRGVNRSLHRLQNVQQRDFRGWSG